MNANIKEIQFIDIDTGAPLITLDGDKAQVLLEQSELIQTLTEVGGQANPRVLVVPIGGFTNERRMLFVNILKGLPVGRTDMWGHIEYYPIGEKEEQNIARAVNEAATSSAFARINVSRDHDNNDERKRVIYETMRYLIIPDELIKNMLVFDSVDSLYSSVNRELTEEDFIDHHLKYQVKWLFFTGQHDKLTPSELEAAQQFADDTRREYETEMKYWQKAANNAAKSRNRRGRRAIHRRPWRYYNSNSNSNNDYSSNNNINAIDHMRREIEERYSDTIDSNTYRPVKGGPIEEMTVREYERWLRTVGYKKAPLELNQFHLNTLYNENRRAEKGRVNRPRVILVNNTNTTRKKNNKKGKGSGAGNSNGSAW